MHGTQSSSQGKYLVSAELIVLPWQQGGCNSEPWQTTSNLEAFSTQRSMHGTQSSSHSRNSKAGPMAAAARSYIESCVQHNTTCCFITCNVYNMVQYSLIYELFQVDRYYYILVQLYQPCKTWLKMLHILSPDSESKQRFLGGFGVVNSQSISMP